MRNTIIINSKKKEIEITKAFEKAASRFGSDEYNTLKQARMDNPSFKVVVVKRKTVADSFKGLTFEVMEDYIKNHDDDKSSIMKEFMDRRGTSNEAKETCAGSKSYFEIKKWFLETYPEIKEFRENRSCPKTAA